MVVGHCCESGDLLTPIAGAASEIARRSLDKAEIGERGGGKDRQTDREKESVGGACGVAALFVPCVSRSLSTEQSAGALFVVGSRNVCSPWFDNPFAGCVR